MNLMGFGEGSTINPITRKEEKGRQMRRPKKGVGWEEKGMYQLGMISLEGDRNEQFIKIRFCFYN